MFLVFSFSKSLKELKEGVKKDKLSSWIKVIHRVEEISENLPF